MTELATDLDKPESALYEEAGKYMKELIARPSAFFIDMKARLDRFMLSQGYEDEIVFDKMSLRACARRCATIPPCCSSHTKPIIDGVTPTDLAYQNDLPMVHVFGGINLDFFGLGFVLRRAGTILFAAALKITRSTSSSSATMSAIYWKSASR